MKTLENNEIRNAVREKYSRVAEFSSGSCGCGPSCCGERNDDRSAERMSIDLGYSADNVRSAPEGTNLGLGCGNPQTIASLKVGETVLDLGSGGGFDCFLAAKAVGVNGKVIGVDMTPAMVDKARKNADKSDLYNVDFRLGEIENLPVPDRTVDVIISNCVINLSPEKKKVFQDAYRVLKPGGRLAISDVVATAELPKKIQQDLELYTGCIGGASSIGNLNAMLKTAGFTNIRINPKDESKRFIRNWVPGSKIEDYVVSATIEAIKPIV